MADLLVRTGPSGNLEKWVDLGAGVFARQVAASAAASELHIGAVGGHSAKPQAAFTRPADTNIYAAGDVVCDSTSAPTVMTFASVARVAAGSGVIQGATLVDSANQATKGSFELWLFDAAPTPDNDNAVFTPTDAEAATLVAVIPFTTSYVGDATSGAGGNAVFLSDPVNRSFVCAGGSTALYGVLVARNGYTPVSGEVFTVRLSVLQD